jgi:hypothetical protein
MALRPLNLSYDMHRLNQRLQQEAAHRCDCNEMNLWWPRSRGGGLPWFYHSGPISRIIEFYAVIPYSYQEGPQNYATNFNDQSMYRRRRLL